MLSSFNQSFYILTEHRASGSMLPPYVILLYSTKKKMEKKRDIEVFGNTVDAKV